MRTIPSLQIERFFLCTLVIDAVARRISRRADALAMKRGEKQRQGSDDGNISEDGGKNERDDNEKDHREEQARSDAVGERNIVRWKPMQVAVWVDQVVGLPAVAENFEEGD